MIAMMKEDKVFCQQDTEIPCRCRTGKAGGNWTMRVLLSKNRVNRSTRWWSSSIGSVLCYNPRKDRVNNSPTFSLQKDILTNSYKIKINRFLGSSNHISHCNMGCCRLTSLRSLLISSCWHRVLWRRLQLKSNKNRKQINRATIMTSKLIWITKYNHQDSKMKTTTQSLDNVHYHRIPNKGAN